MISVKLLLFVTLALAAGLVHSQVVLESTVYNPQNDQQQGYTATIYPVQQQQTQQQEVVQVTTLAQEPRLTTTTIVNQVPSTTTIVNQVQQPQTVLTQRTVYYQPPPQPTVVRTVVNSVIERVEMPAVTVTVTQTVEVRPRVRIIPTTIVRTMLVTETLPVDEPETITETAIITTTLRAAEVDARRIGAVLATETITKTMWATPTRAPDTNTYSSVTTNDGSKFVATKTETTYFPQPNAAASSVSLRYSAAGTFWTRTNIMQLGILAAVLVVSQAVVAKMFA